MMHDCQGVMEYISPTDKLNPYNNCKPCGMISKVSASTAASSMVSIANSSSVSAIGGGLMNPNLDALNDTNDEEGSNSINFLKEYPEEYHVEIPANLDKKLYDEAITLLK